MTNNEKLENQTKSVVTILMRLEGIDRTTAIKLWMESKTKRVIQDENNLSHLSGARCYDELKMELTKDPFWMKGQID
jgi:hypothetical protein